MRIPAHLRPIKITRLPRDKDAQVEITVREMIRITLIEAWNPDVRWLVSHARLPHFTREETAEAFKEDVKRRVRFELDPEDVELIRTPSYYAREIRRGMTHGGDCDDLALLLATMLYSAGFSKIAYVVMATSPTVREFRHVFVTAHIGHHWRAYDPSVSRPYETNGLRTKWYYVPWGKGPPAL